MNRRPALLPAALLISALALAGCKSNKERAEEHLHNAEKFVKTGDYGRANIEFRNAIQLDPSGREARMAFAAMLEKQGNAAAAYGQYASLVEHKPDDVEAITRAALIAAELGDWKAAGQQAKAGLALKSDDTQLQAVQAGVDYATALSNRDAEARAKAAATARDLSAKLPDNLMLRRLIVDNDMREGKYDAARKEIDAALKIAPENRALLAQRLSVLAALKDEPAIEAQLKQMVKLFPGDQAVEGTLLRWYVSRKKLDDAEAYLRQLAKDAKPDDQARADMSLVTFLMQYRGPDKALVELDRIIASGNLPSTPNQAAAEDKKGGKKAVGTDLTVESFRALKASIEFQQGKRDTAIQDMKSILDKAPSTDETRRLQVVLAKMLYATGDKVGARAEVEKVLAADGGQVQALTLKAGWLIDSDDTDGAISLLRTALESKSNDIEAMTLMARAYARAGKQDLAGDMLSQAYEASNRAPTEALRYAAFLSQASKDIPAETVLIDALRLNPSNVQLLTSLGQLYVKMKDWPRAQGVVTRLEQIGTPGAAQIAEQLKPAVLAGQQNLGAATEYLQGLVKEGKGGIGAQVAVIRNLLSEGKVPDAKQAADKLLAEKPDDPSRRFIAASVQAATGDSAGAEAVYRDLLKQDPKRDRVWLALIRLMAVTGQQDKVPATIDEAIKAMPDSVPLLQLKASQDERTGKIDDAIAIYQKLYDQNPNSAVNANNLASLLSSYKGDDPKAVEHAYTIARRLSGTKVPPFADTYGWLAFQRGHPQEAESYLETAAAALTRDPMVQYHLAKVYEALKKPEKARAQFQKVVALVTPGDTRPFVQESRKALAAPANPPANDGTSGASDGSSTGTTGN